MARRQPHWKVIEHVNHKRFLDGGVIVVKEDPDVIHFVNSYNLLLSTSLNDLDNATLHIDVQSTEVDALPDIIDLDEDDDIIDDEDALPHDLADSDDEDLVNINDDDGVDMLHGATTVTVAVMIIPLHTIYLPVAGVASLTEAKALKNLIWVEEKQGTLHTRQEIRNLGLKKIIDDKSPVPIRFEWDDKKILMPLGKHASHWSNYLAELIREMPLYYPSWQKVPAKRKAAIMTKIGRRPENITPTDWDAQIALWNDPRNQTQATHNRQNREKSTFVCRQGSRSLARLRDHMMESSTTREYPSLIHTFFVTHTVGGVFTRDEDRAIYEEILSLQALGSNTPVLPGRATDFLLPPLPQCTHNSVDVEKLKKKNKHLTKQVNLMMKLFRSDNKFSQMLNQYASSPEFGNASGNGGCGDDEMVDDEYGGEDEEDEEDGDS
nr:hypothetical protein [Tanacetum cinerariifolium]